MRRLIAYFNALRFTPAVGVKRGIYRDLTGEEPPAELLRKWEVNNKAEVKKNYHLFLEGASKGEIVEAATKEIRADLGPSTQDREGKHDASNL